MKEKVAIKKLKNGKVKIYYFIDDVHLFTKEASEGSVDTVVEEIRDFIDKHKGMTYMLIETMKLTEEFEKCNG